MLNKRRITLGSIVAAAAISIGGAAMAASPAAADGPDTPEHVVTSIQEQDWVELSEGDSGYRVAAVQYFLIESGHFAGEVDTEFTHDLREAVIEYQVDNEINDSGNVDDGTWEQLSDDTGLVQQGDNREDLVTGLQTSLYDLGYDLDIDGQYGSGTENAVTAFQEDAEIDDDGIVGPLTFKAMYAEDAEN